MVGQDFCGTVPHPDGDKELSPEVNEILTFNVPGSDGIKYMDFMNKSYDRSGTNNVFIRITSQGDAVFKKGANESNASTFQEIILSPEELEARKKFPILCSEYLSFFKDEVYLVNPTFREIDFELQEPGQQTCLENLLNLLQAQSK